MKASNIALFADLAPAGSDFSEIGGRVARRR